MRRRGVADDPVEQDHLGELDPSAIQSDARRHVSRCAGAQREVVHAVQVESERAAIAMVDLSLGCGGPEID